MARQGGSSIGRGIRKSVVDSTAGSDDSTTTADCGKGQGWGSADGKGVYRSTECIGADVKMAACRLRSMGNRRTRKLST
eukprot:scaffold19604_cov60-Attheya_sp.AAC.9